MTRLTRVSTFMLEHSRSALSALALLIAFTVPMIATAIPVLSATPGNASHAFDVGAVHQLGGGAFTDRFAFRLGSDVSLRSTSLHFATDISGFVAELYGDTGLIATGISEPTGVPQDEGYVNSIFVPSLAGNKDYEIRIRGTDLWGDFGNPYMLSLRVGPAIAQTETTLTAVPEPPTFVMVGCAMMLMFRRRAGKQHTSQTMSI